MQEFHIASYIKDELDQLEDCKFKYNEARLLVAYNYSEFRVISNRHGLLDNSDYSDENLHNQIIVTPENEISDLLPFNSGI